MNNLNELTIKEYVAGIKKGAFKCTDVLEACFNRLEEMDPKMNTFVTICKEEAFHKAKKADKVISDKGVEVFINIPLFGVPYACKDNFNTKGVETTASSNILKGYIP